MTVKDVNEIMATFVVFCAFHIVFISHSVLLLLLPLILKCSQIILQLAALSSVKADDVDSVCLNHWIDFQLK